MITTHSSIQHKSWEQGCHTPHLLVPGGREISSILKEENNDFLSPPPKKNHKEFPGGIIVRNQCFHHHGPGSIPGLGTDIPHQATAHGDKKKKKITRLQDIRLLLQVWYKRLHEGVLLWYQQVKDPALSLQWLGALLGLDPWPGNFHQP